MALWAVPSLHLRTRHGFERYWPLHEQLDVPLRARRAQDDEQSPPRSQKRRCDLLSSDSTRCNVLRSRRVSVAQHGVMCALCALAGQDAAAASEEDVLCSDKIDLRATRAAQRAAKQPPQRTMI